VPVIYVKVRGDIAAAFGHGRILDPACGSGGMFVQSARFVERQQIEFIANIVRLYRGEKAENMHGSNALLEQHFLLRTPERIALAQRVMGRIEEVLDRSIGSEGYVIREKEAEERIVDLSQIDFDALRKAFEEKRKHTTTEKLQGATVLDRLPERFEPDIYLEKCSQVYQHVFEAYLDADHHVYARSA